MVVLFSLLIVANMKRGIFLKGNAKVQTLSLRR